MQPVPSLKISISGVRGIVGEALTPLLLVRFAEAFAAFCNRGPVLLGRDTRRSGEMAEQAVLAGLLTGGCRVWQAGVVPTPTVQYNVPRRGCAGGIIVTASHNPEEWNALKLVAADGRFLSPLQAEELLDIYHQEQPPRPPGISRAVSPVSDVLDQHLAGVLAQVDVELIRQRRFKVAVDAVNGAGSVLTPRFLEALGVDAVLLHTTPGAGFPHTPEPLPEHLGELCAVVRQAGCDLGFAQDPDADRLALVDETGCCLGGEYTLALAVKHALARRGGGVVVVNLSTSRAIDDVARFTGAEVHRSPIGEINVILEMQRRGAVIGGEGNGGVIDPSLHYARDSFIGMALILEHLARHGGTVSDALAGVGRYAMVRRRLPRPPLREVGRMRSTLERHFASQPGARLDTRDGVRIDLPQGWVHLRASNTEPILRLVAEAAAEEVADDLVAQVAAVLQLG
ncbi:MAG: phosphoglucosamine mutase [Fimbriimonadaceae bacterium]|nr:phosphoglucosamine mutase [Fimbriimonadaceae bacterium]